MLARRCVTSEAVVFFESIMGERRPVNCSTLRDRADRHVRIDQRRAAEARCFDHADIGMRQRS
jgi:hypothetical protein